MKSIMQCMLGILLLTGMTACEKDSESAIFPPELSTGEATGITRFEAVLTGMLTANPRSLEEQEHSVFFLYSSQSPSLLESVDTISAVRKENNVHTAQLSKLEAGKKYYYCLAASSGYSIVKGAIKSFTTKATAEPTVTIAVNGTTEYTLSLTGNIDEDGGAQIRSKGFVYKQYVEGDDEPTTENGTNVPGIQGIGTDFYAEISGLTPETNYIIRAYASNGTTASGYSEAIILKTSKLLVPLINTAAATDLTAYSAVFHGKLLSDNGFPVKECGFCYSSESAAPTLDHPTVKTVMTGNEFSAEAKGLEPTKTYNFRAYAINDKGVAYGEVMQCTLPEVQTLTLTAPVVSNITISAADVVASVNLPQGASFTEKGICYSSTVTLPTLSETIVSDPSQGNQIAVGLSELKEGTTYNLRAYVVSRDGTFYSSPVQFNTVQTTKAEINSPTISNVTLSAATFHARIASDGGTEILSKGFCYSKNAQNPTIDNTLVEDASNGKEINASVSDLEEGATYYARAYATNKNGTAYSSMASFKTIEYFKPTVSDLIQISVSDDHATMKATLVNNGGMPLKEVGFCWSNNSSEPSPTQNPKVIATLNGTTFEASLTGLAYNTNYYVRAYAINDKGTGYSGFVQIRTQSSNQPTLGTLTANDITSNSVSVSATISSDGGAAIEEKGFCYSTQGTPSLTDHPVVISSPGNTVQTTLNDLGSYTKYYIRAYAKNKNGVAYSNVLTVTTKKTNPDVTDPVSPGNK